jgi:hypothetical protein
MRSILVGSIVFAVVFGGALAGIALRWVLPESQLGPEVKDIIQISTGLLVTMTALVLGMLVSSANSSYQERKSELAEMASNFVVVHLLASFGLQTEEIRRELRALADVSVERIWPSQKSRQSELRPTGDGQLFFEHLQNLLPKNEAQTLARNEAIVTGVRLRRTYWIMFIKSEQNSLPFPLLVVVVAWLTAIFISFGLFAPTSYTVILSLLVCALSVSGAVFIVMEMYTPFRGIMRISSSPIHDALSRMGPASAPERVLSERSDLHRDSGLSP